MSQGPSPARTVKRQPLLRGSHVSQCEPLPGIELANPILTTIMELQVAYELGMVRLVKSHSRSFADRDQHKLRSGSTVTTYPRAGVNA